MAKYDYECTVCGLVREEIHGMNEKPELICGCGNTEPMTKLFVPTTNFYLTGAGWPGKDSKEKGYRIKRRKTMGKKMALSHDIPSLVPNFNGEICSSWDDAKKLAKDKGSEVSTYDQKVKVLEHQQNKIKEKKSLLIKGESL